MIRLVNKKEKGHLINSSIRAVIFAEHLYDQVLLPVPTSHVVFTIPKRLRVFFKYNRKLIQHLYTAAWSSWSELIEDALPDDCESGMVMSLHTAGDLINFHPHVHGLSVHIKGICQKCL